MAHIITDHLVVVQEEHWVTCATVHTVDGVISSMQRPFLHSIKVTALSAEMGQIYSSVQETEY